VRMKSAASVLVLCVFVASGAAAKICKSVGPDGAVIFTDRPTASCDTAPASSETAATPKPSAGTVSVAASATMGAKKSSGLDPSADEPNQRAATDRVAVEKSVIGIMGLEDAIQRAYDFCASVSPASTPRYGNAADGWRERNVSATAKMRRALAQAFNPSQQRQMAEGVKARNQAQLAPVLASPKAAQIKWCDQNADQIDARVFDAKEPLTASLTNF
jgi:hypothetical protein